jgi:acyl carrier protein
MDYQSLENFIKNELLYLPKSQVLTKDVSLLALGLDSLKMFRLMVFIEENYNINIPDNMVTPSAFSSIRSIINLLESL